MTSSASHAACRRAIRGYGGAVVARLVVRSVHSHGLTGRREKVGGEQDLECAGELRLRDATLANQESLEGGPYSGAVSMLVNLVSNFAN